MHKLNVDNTVQWELLMLKLSLSIFSMNLETTWSPPNMLVTVLFHLNKNAKVTVIRKQTPRHKAQLIWNIMLKLGKMNELLRRLNNIRLPKWNDFWIYLTLQNPLNTLMQHGRTRLQRKLHWSGSMWLHFNTQSQFRPRSRNLHIRHNVCFPTISNSPLLSLVLIVFQKFSSSNHCDHKLAWILLESFRFIRAKMKLQMFENHRLLWVLPCG